MNRAELRARLELHDQAHVLARLDDLDVVARARLVEQIESLDLDELSRVWREASRPVAPLEASSLDPVSCAPLDLTTRARLDARGRELIAAGKVAMITVAGGEGTRLGFDAPKGCFPISPVRNATLFRLFAEGVVAARRAGGAELPWLIMTSPATETGTREHLQGLDSLLSGNGGYRTFVQGTRPVLSEHGRLLLAAPDRLAVAPDGHGGVVDALARSGLLDELESSGVEFVFYHQIDNVFGQRPDPVQIGLTAENDAEMTVKVVEKTDPREKVGVLSRDRGRTRVVEYSELPDDLARKEVPGGGLAYSAGSIAIHTFTVEFLKRAASTPLPIHLAWKRVACLDEEGELVEPDVPNACKLETFVFDLLPRARRTAFLMAPRSGEFCPLKDARGRFSAAAVRKELSRWWASWLVSRGHSLPPGASADGETDCEISPLVASCAAELPADAGARAAASFAESGSILLAENGDRI